MSGDVFGRTNVVVPRVWLSLGTNPEPGAGSWLTDLCDAAVQSNLPIDISTSPALWGGGLRGTQSLLVYSGGDGTETVTSDRVAEFIQGQLIEVLSAVGRDYLDFFFLKVERGWEESAIEGALRALEFARQEGMVRFLGIRCGRSALATLSLWQFHDAFEALAVAANPEDYQGYEMLNGLAAKRRVGVLNCEPVPRARLNLNDHECVEQIRQASLVHPVQVRTSSPLEIEILTTKVLNQSRPDITQ